MTSHCFDTDILSALMRADPPLGLIRKIAEVPPAEQSTTSITLAEMLYGAARRKSGKLVERIRDLLTPALTILPFDRAAAEVYGPLRADLEAQGRRLAEPDLRIASIALSRSITLVTGNVRHFVRVPNLSIENWLDDR
jgi:predicted nucleic acid-binding protein